MASKKEIANDDFVRMYYEHQYDRMAKQEEYRLTMTNYVLTISALAFTFGYQGNTQLTVVNGIGLPVIIVLANIFAIATINRTAQYIWAHKKRAHQVLEEHAPALEKINNNIKWKDAGVLGSRHDIQGSLHKLLIAIALIPIGLYLYQIL
jgi:hypothetical protein